MRQAVLSLKRKANELHAACEHGQAEIRKAAKYKRTHAGKRCVLCTAWFVQGEHGVVNASKYCPDCRDVDSRIEKFGVAYEVVNSKCVFVRDEYICQHCGRLAPESLSGTLHDWAPSLDHILPLSKGGAHSYANTQCSHRQCNSEKLANIAQEMKLVGVTDFTQYMVAAIPARILRDVHTLEIIGKSEKNVQKKRCACPCRELFTPCEDGNNADFKKGHWKKTDAARYAQHVAGCLYSGSTAESLDFFLSLH